MSERRLAGGAPGLMRVGGDVQHRPEHEGRGWILSAAVLLVLGSAFNAVNGR
jgi:hypothetical protein